MSKLFSTFPTSLDTTLSSDRQPGDTITSDSYDIIETALSALELRVGIDGSSDATSLTKKTEWIKGSTGLSAITISATTYTNLPNTIASATCATQSLSAKNSGLLAGLSASQLSGSGTDPATAYSGTLLSAASVSATNLTAVAVTATNLTAVNISATTYVNLPSGGTGDIKSDGTVAFTGPVTGTVIWGSTSISAVTMTATTSKSVTFSGTNVKATTITATDLSGTNLSGTNVYSTTVTATNLSATNLSGTNSYTSLVTATTVNATTITGTTVWGSTAISAATISATTYSNLPTSTGKIAQIVSVLQTSIVSGNTAMPIDNTIPQITEGWMVMSGSITPTNSSSTLIFDFSGAVSNAGGNLCGIALFKTGTSNALASLVSSIANNGGYPIRLLYSAAAGSTSALGFQIRVGNNGGNYQYVGGFSDGNYMGGTFTTAFFITEVTP